MSCCLIIYSLPHESKSDARSDLMIDPVHVDAVKWKQLSFIRFCHEHECYTLVGQ